MTKIGVILGSMREQRHGAYILSWLLEQAPQDSETAIVVLDLQNYNMPFFGQKDTDGIAAKWKKDTQSCDAFVFLAAEMHHSISGALKNAIDWLSPELHHKPVGIVAYGFAASGGRAVEHLKAIFSSFSMITIEPNVLISLMDDVKEGVFVPRPWHNQIAQTMLEELMAWIPYSQTYLSKYDHTARLFEYNDEWSGLKIQGRRPLCGPKKKDS